VIDAVIVTQTIRNPNGLANSVGNRRHDDVRSKQKGGADEQ
jgi:hypothetical protein